MKNREELKAEEMDRVNGGFSEGELCIVEKTKNYLALRKECNNDDSNIIKKYHNNDAVIFRKDAGNGFALVEDIADGSRGYVKKDYLI